ncbi:RHS repeat-associated protein [Luteibacter rhizovicinus]|uniref:RHS repeat-associated protein n=1 Tax=Luteibacter rhizovicinus TaxID=242606 RepID=A0A4R3YJS9_9GAMM|nr:DUF4329 domain-containing protein [Luteibacter rhizovicinus]TCV91638.1 RHS repeat-associated protein [Luteibacter rhizovicinus]
MSYFLSSRFAARVPSCDPSPGMPRVANTARRASSVTNVLNCVVGLIAFISFAPTVRAEEVTYYLTNPQGTPLATTDAQNNITRRLDQKPYGDGVLDEEKGVGYTGHVIDADTDYVYMQARYYDPLVGRFLSVDPHPSDTGSVFFFNRFAYARNAPSRYSDEDGEKPGDKFATPEQAAYDALQYINARSIAENHEYLGYIVILERQFVATEAVRAAEDHANAPMPEGIPVVGDYHTHGNYTKKVGSEYVIVDSASDGFDSDNFSTRDKLRYAGFASILKHVYRGYLGTPSGKSWVYDPSVGKAMSLDDMVREQRRYADERAQEMQRDRDMRRDVSDQNH